MITHEHTPIDEYYCQNCERVCVGKFVDLGIGAYEYFGKKGFDSNIQWLSGCCEDTVMLNGVELDGPES